MPGSHPTLLETGASAFASSPVFRIPCLDSTGAIGSWRPVTYSEFHRDIELYARHWTHVLRKDGIHRKSVIGLWLSGLAYTDVLHIYDKHREGVLSEEVDPADFVFPSVSRTAGFPQDQSEAEWLDSLLDSLGDDDVLVDVEHDAGSFACLPTQDPQLHTHNGTHMFSHSHEVSIHGGKFNNVGRDSVVLSNSNNTIYQSYGHVSDSGLCSRCNLFVAPYPLLGLQDVRFSKELSSSSRTDSPGSSTPKSPSSIGLPSSELLVHKSSSLSTPSVLCTCNCGSEEEEDLKSLKIGINIGVDVSDGGNSPSELQHESEELFSGLALPNVVAEQSINSITTSTQGYPSIEEVRRVLSVLPTSRKPDLFKVLSFLIYSYDDLPLSSIASLLFPDDPSSLCKLLSFIDLIISTPHDNDRLEFTHPSLKLLFGDRSCAGGFFVSYVRGHGILLQCCTEYMKRLSWESRGGGIGSVDEQALEYACRYWERHRRSLDVAKL